MSAANEFYKKVLPILDEVRLSLIETDESDRSLRVTYNEYSQSLGLNSGNDYAVQKVKVNLIPDEGKIVYMVIENNVKDERIKQKANKVFEELAEKFNIEISFTQ